MTAPVRMFAELCAGMAAVSLCLQGGRHARPPCSRPGNKAGLAPVVLGLAGLRPGQRADAFLWAEPEPGPRALLQCYPDPERLRSVAVTVRGWIGRPPRPLWDELRAMGPAAGVPGWLFVQGNRYGDAGGFKPVPTARPNTDANLSPEGLADALEAVSAIRFPPVALGPDARELDPAAVARWLVLGSWSFRRGQPESGYNRGVAEASTATPTHHGGGPLTVDDIARNVARLDVVDFPPVAIGEDARAVDPAVVARWLLLQRWSFSEKGPAHGYGGPGCAVKAGAHDWTTEGRDASIERDKLANTIERVSLSWPDVLVGDDARSVHPDAASADLDGCVVFIDPPYVGTTPYANALTRAEVVDLALRWDAAGATVLVSEAVPVAELDLPGWHVADLSRERRGQARTWSKQQGEFVTMNRPPVVRPATQPRLFALTG